jgi:hypothetical protein
VILDFSARPDEARLYEVLDAETGEPIAEPLSYADDEQGFYRRRVYLSDDVCYTDPAAVFRPIRIVPRLERLCASLRASLAEQGVSADDIPEPVLGALALFDERLKAIERFVVTRRESIPRPPAPHRYTPRSEEEIRRITGASSPPVHSAEWLESVTRPDPAFAADPNHHLVRSLVRGSTTDIPHGRPWTRADLERFLPEIRLETCTTAERLGNPDGRYPVCMPRIGDATTCERCGGHVDLAINRPCPREQRWGPSVESVTTPEESEDLWGSRWR